MRTFMATFDDIDRAADAMGALMDHGISEHSMDLVANESYGKMLAQRKRNEYAERATRGVTTTTGADAVEGAKRGGTVGLAAGIVAGFASLVIPGYGIVVGGGALATALASALGTSVAGLTAGGITGYLKDMGVDEKIARDFDDTVRNGGGVLTVTGTDQAAPGITSILEKYRASSIVKP